MVMFCLLLFTQHKPKALCPGEELYCDMLWLHILSPFSEYVLETLEIHLLLHSFRKYKLMSQKSSP